MYIPSIIIKKNASYFFILS